MRAKKIIVVAGYQFKDLDDDSHLDAYEDWRLPVNERISDLVGKMTLEEKAGMMLIDTMNAGCGGNIPPSATGYITNQNMTRFIFRNKISASPVCGTDTSGEVSPSEAATFTNAVQEMGEATRLGIPILFKSNARNHIDPDARVGINESSGAFTAFPKESGLAAAALGEESAKTGKPPTTGDMSVIKSFTDVMGSEWKSIGLRGMYGYMADLSTEPRWWRVHETFTENADLAANIIRALVQNLQGTTIEDGTSVSPRSAVALTIKHFPGGGPQEEGYDPHYAYGKNQVYTNEEGFAYHLRPFKAAIDAGVSAIMPYYGVPTAGRDSNGKPVSLTYDGVTYSQMGFAFSKEILSDLLRGKLGFKGYVNSDTGIVNDRAWGLEKKTVPERVAAAINAGTDILSGFHEKQVIIDLVKQGLISEARVNEAVKRLLKEQFRLGLFENPYVEATKAADRIGNALNQAVALDVQRKSIVLLQNDDQGNGTKVLPLKPNSRVYILGELAKASAEKYGYRVTDGNLMINGARPSAAEHDYALILVTALVNRKVTSEYRSNDVGTGLNPDYINPFTGKSWGYEDRCVDLAGYSEGSLSTKVSCLDDGLRFGGVLPWETSSLSFTKMAGSASWLLKPSLTEIKAIMSEVGAKNTILAIYFRQPYVLDEASGMRGAGAILAHFGVSDTALLDIVSGKVKPQGRMPFALARNLDAIKEKKSDEAGYPEKDTLYGFGFGLNY